MSAIEGLKPIIKQSIISLGGNGLKDKKSIDVFYNLRMRIIYNFINKVAGRTFESKEDAKNFVQTLPAATRIKYAFILLAIDAIANSILIAILNKVIPDSLGKKIYELNMKLAAIIAKRTLNDKKVQENADKILSTLKIIAFQIDFNSGNRTASDYSNPNIIKELIDNSGPTVGKFLLAGGIAASLNEEASKRASIDLGFSKEYFAVFNAFEFTSYVLSLNKNNGMPLKTAIAVRIITVGVHAALTGLHNIGFHKSATLAHFLHNTFGLGIQEIHSMIVNDISLSVTASNNVLMDKIKEYEKKRQNLIDSKLADDNEFIGYIRSLSKKLKNFEIK